MSIASPTREKPVILAVTPLATFGRCTSCRHRGQRLVEVEWSDGARYEVCGRCLP